MLVREQDVRSDRLLQKVQGAERGEGGRQALELGFEPVVASFVL